MTFSQMLDATREEWEQIERLEADYYDPVEGVLSLLTAMRDDDPNGHPVNAYVHSLQAATRALRAGEPDDMVVAALLHDAATAIAPENHGQVVAEIIRPYVSEEVYWVIRHHGVVQKLYMVNHPYWSSGVAEAAVAPLRGQPYFERTRQFCEDYDQAAFDADYDTLPLEAFRDKVDAVFAREAFRPA